MHWLFFFAPHSHFYYLFRRRTMLRLPFTNNPVEIPDAVVAFIVLFVGRVFRIFHFVLIFPPLHFSIQVRTHCDSVQLKCYFDSSTPTTMRPTGGVIMTNNHNNEMPDRLPRVVSYAFIINMERIQFFCSNFSSARISRDYYLPNSGGVRCASAHSMINGRACTGPACQYSRI